MTAQLKVHGISDKVHGYLNSQGDVFFICLTASLYFVNFWLLQIKDVSGFV